MKMKTDKEEEEAYIALMMDTGTQRERSIFALFYCLW